MSGDAFEQAWRITAPEEGGHNPDDEGSDTWYGIRRAAKARARARYWTAYHLELLPVAFGAAVFDWLYNGGQPIHALQEVLGVAPDGEVGPATARAAGAVRDPVRTLQRLFARRGYYYASLESFSRHWESWLTRLFDVYVACVALARRDA